ncbi:MAG: nucleotide exchange factor GrpE [Gemmataceae bacterium]
MSEFAAAGVAGDAAEPGPQGVATGPLDRAVAAFRDWFAANLQADNADLPTSQDTPAIDLHTLLGHFVALRQEVNLQTRAVRGQQEQTAETVRTLQQAVDALTRAVSRGEQADEASADDAVRPLLTSLVELYDALARAGRELTRTADALPPLDEPADEEPEPAAWPPLSEAARPGLLSRLVGHGHDDAAVRRLHAEAAAVIARLQQERREARQQAADAARHLRRTAEALDAVITGYEMSLERVERALERHGLEPIPAVGEPFDPETMEAVEAVADSGRPAGEVLDEVRRGYLYPGRVFRYAQVRVARGDRPRYEGV